MAKREMTVYTCDRCGAEITNTIKDRVFNIGHFKYIHVFKWFVPMGDRYRLFYLCRDCWKSFMDWAFIDKEAT